MLDREVVQRFYDCMVRSNSNVERNRSALPLLDAYPELAQVCFQDYEVGTSWFRDYPLHDAIYYRDYELVQKLVALGADVNAKNGQCKTPLAAALQRAEDDFEIVLAMIEMLLQSGADPNLPGDFGNTVLYSAVNHRKAATIVPLLLRYGADPNHRNHGGAVPLDYWRKRTTVGDVESYMEVLHLLITHGADINARSNGGGTPLMSAISHGCRAVKEMLAYGADVHAKTKGRWTAMHCAAMAFDAEEAEEIALLLKAGASCHVKDSQGYTPLHVAASLCGMEAARLLVEAGADVNAGNYRGVTPLDLVDARKSPFLDSHPEEGKYERMAAFLREQGATSKPGILKKRAQ